MTVEQEPRAATTATASAVVVDGTAVQRYAAATNDDNPRYAVGGDGVPPLYAFVLGWDALRRAIVESLDGAEVWGFVHLRQLVVNHCPLRRGDVVVPTARVASLATSPMGASVTAELRVGLEGQAPASTCWTTVLVRGTGFTPVVAAAPPPFRVSQPPVEPRTVHDVVEHDQAVRYAAASGDDNPIHLNPDLAAAAGLRGVILHGMCTLAFAVRAVVAAVGSGDPARVEAVAGRFGQPVHLGDRLRTTVWPGDGECTFRVDGPTGAVLRHGMARCR